MEEMKASEEVPAPRSGVAKASDSLIALIRGARKKDAASMLGVVKSNKTTDFVPSDPKPKGNSDRGARAHRNEKIRQQRMKKGKRIVSGKIYLAPKMTMSKKKK